MRRERGREKKNKTASFCAPARGSKQEGTFPLSARESLHVFASTTSATLANRTKGSSTRDVRLSTASASEVRFDCSAASAASVAAWGRKGG